MAPAAFVPAFFLILHVPLCSLQSETAVEGARSRTDVTVAGDVAVLGSSRLPLMQLSGREEEFAFRRAVSVTVQ